MKVVLTIVVGMSTYYHEARSNVQLEGGQGKGRRPQQQWPFDQTCCWAAWVGASIS